MNTAAVELLSPVDDALINGTGINLTWDIKNTKDEWMEYHVYLGDSPEELEEINVTAKRIYSLQLPQENHTYYWKIVAEFTGTHRLIGSDVRSFTVIEQFISISDIRLSLNKTDVRIAKGEFQIVRLNVSNHGNQRETVSIELFGGLKGHVHYNPIVVLGPGRYAYVDLNISAGELLDTDTYLLTIRAEYSGGIEEIKLSIRVIDPERDHETTDSNLLIRISGGGLLFLLIIIIFVIVLKRKKRKKEELKRKADESTVSDKELPETKKTDPMRFSAGTPSDLYSSFNDLPPAAPERQYPTYPADSDQYDFFAPSAPKPGMGIRDGFGAPTIGNIGKDDPYPSADVKGDSAPRTYDIEVLLPESPSLVGNGTGDVSLLSPGRGSTVSSSSKSPDIEETVRDEMVSSAPSLPSYISTAPIEAVTIEEPLRDIPVEMSVEMPVEMPPTPKEEQKSIIEEDYGDISSETDTFDEPSSVLSDSENVLDSFSKFLQKMPSSLPPSERPK